MSHDVRSCDVLVIGRGAAGCIASLRLAEAGHEVLLVGKETSATSLSTGRIDLRGVENEIMLSSTLRRLGLGHGLFQSSEVSEAITNYGTLARQSLSSGHDWCDPFDGSIAVMGLRGNPDLDPQLLCSVLRRTKPHLRCDRFQADLGLPCSIPSGNGATLSEEASAAADLISSALSDRDEDNIILPPLFAGPNYAQALSTLERSSGRRVLEPMTPLSNPGGRLQACLEEGAIKAGCTIWKERELCGLEIEGSTAAGAFLRSGLRRMAVRPKAIILAMGSLVTGGLAVKGEEVLDPLGLFASEPAQGNELASLLLTGALSVGIGNDGGKAVLLDGTVMDNVLVAGSAVPGLSYPMGRGLGHVIADAWTKAGTVEEAL